MISDGKQFFIYKIALDRILVGRLRTRLSAGACQRIYILRGIMNHVNKIFRQNIAARFDSERHVFHAAIASALRGARRVHVLAHPDAA